MTDTVRSKTECKEYFDEDFILAKKAGILADAIKNAKHAYVFTGAGISTSAGIADFRSGVNTVLDTGAGLWEKRKAVKEGVAVKAPKKVVASTLKAYPTYTHMALKKLLDVGLLKFLVSQNTDGLHKRSGVPPDLLAELHGNSNLETCKKCKRQYLRDFKCRNNKNVHQHETGRICDDPTCDGQLKDSIINFGENLPGKELGNAERHSEMADVCLVLGSSLTVTPAADGPETVGANPRAQLHIVNLQSTPLDVFATQRLNGKCDDVMRLLMKELKLEVEPWKMLRGAKVDVSVVEQKMKTTGAKAPGKASAKSTAKASSKAGGLPPATGNGRNSRILAISKNLQGGAQPATGGARSSTGSKSSVTSGTSSGTSSAAASARSTAKATAANGAPGPSTNSGAAPSIAGGRTTILNQTTITPVSAAIKISVDGFDPSSAMPFHLFQSAELYFYEQANFSIQDQKVLNDLLVKDNVEEISTKYLNALNVAVLKDSAEVAPGCPKPGNVNGARSSNGKSDSTVALKNKILLERNKTRPLEFSVTEDKYRDVFQVWCKLMAPEGDGMEVEDANSNDNSLPDTAAARLYKKLNTQDGALFLRLSFAGHYEEPDLILPILVEDLIAAGYNKEGGDKPLSNFKVGQKSTCMYELGLSFQERSKNEVKRWGVTVREDEKTKKARNNTANGEDDTISGPWSANADYGINQSMLGGIPGGIGGIGAGIPGMPAFIPGSFSLPPLGNFAVDGQHNRTPPSSSASEVESGASSGTNSVTMPAISNSLNSGKNSPTTNNASASSSSPNSDNTISNNVSDLDRVLYESSETLRQCAETRERSASSMEEFKEVLKGSEIIAARMDEMKEKMDQVMELGARRLSKILVQGAAEERRRGRGGR